MATAERTVADFQRRYFEMLLQSQYWTAEQMQAHQRRELGQLLRHAKGHVRAYRERIDVLFRPNGAIDWDRWSEVPILRRSEILADPESFLADELPPGHGPFGEASTSGSTGYPLRVRYTRLSAITTMAVRYRADTWYGLDWSKPFYARYGRDKSAPYPEGHAGGAWGPAWSDVAQQGKSYRLNYAATAEQQIEYMQRIGAAYLASGGPKQAHSIALETLRLNKKLSIKAILSSGESITAPDRDICREVFGAEIYDVYSSKEGNHMASACPSLTCWHVNAETALLEILDQNGNACRPGEVGRVVITPFYSTAQPLIRYDQGDFAMAGERCVCGRSLPVLSQILGRIVHLFKHPSGRTANRFLPEENRKLLRAGPWQIAQVGANAYELRYVPLNWDEPGDEASVDRAFHETYFSDAQLTFKRMRAIQPMASGKYIEYLNEFGG